MEKVKKEEAGVRIQDSGVRKTNAGLIMLRGDSAEEARYGKG